MKKNKLGLLILLLGCLNTFAQQQATYFPEAAIEYAETWWNGRNTGGEEEWGDPYNSYHNYGGDCANFVSQCLRAGGLILAAGSNGMGNGVDNKGCIKGVENLVTNLRLYQNTQYQSYLNGSSVAPFTDAGDPIFTGNEERHYIHSFFCVGREEGENVCNSHTADLRHHKISSVSGVTRTYYFHILGAYPTHCFNCEQDFDETAIDCGGSCPPCEKAKNYVSYTTNTSSLPAVSRAVINITAGNAQVKVLSQQHVEFISAESIDLLDGFHAEEGSDFSATAKRMRVEATADCNAFCDPEPYNLFLLSEGFRWNVANATGVQVKIYQYCNSALKKIYEATIPIAADGWVVFWNLIAGVDDRKSCDKKQFRYELVFTTCQGVPVSYSGWLAIADPARSLSDNAGLDFTEEEAQHVAFAIAPNPNDGTFSIESNREITEFSNLQVINTTGQTVYEIRALSSPLINLPSELKGLFLVRIHHKEGVFSEKIIVRE